MPVGVMHGLSLIITGRRRSHRLRNVVVVSGEGPGR